MGGGVVHPLQSVGVRGREPWVRLRRFRQALVVVLPTLLERHQRQVESLDDARGGHLHRFSLRTGEADGELGGALPAKVERDSFGNVTAEGAVIAGTQRVGRVELGQAIARLPGESHPYGRERSIGAQCRVPRDRVVPVGGVARRRGVVGDRNRLSGRGVDDRVIRAAVALATPAVAVDRRVQADVKAQRVRADRQRHQPNLSQDAVAVRVGQVRGHKPVLAGLGGAGHLAGHPALARGPHGVGHVAGLQIRETRAIGHDELHRLDVRVVHRRTVDIGQYAVRDGEPDLRRPAVRRTDAVLASEVEMRQCAGAVRRRRRRVGGTRGGTQGGRHGQYESRGQRTSNHHGSKTSGRQSSSRHGNSGHGYSRHRAHLHRPHGVRSPVEIET